mmetsp:Transcript_86094/g.278105  ORF Transcript_86094/g.278105 Transcript_86094/m.278105 type:complete len:244 (+) Transcript_86094:225-956(+)
MGTHCQARHLNRRGPHDEVFGADPVRPPWRRFSIAAPPLLPWRDRGAAQLLQSALQASDVGVFLGRRRLQRLANAKTLPHTATTLSNTLHVIQSPSRRIRRQRPDGRRHCSSPTIGRTAGVGGRKGSRPTSGRAADLSRWFVVQHPCRSMWRQWPDGGRHSGSPIVGRRADVCRRPVGPRPGRCMRWQWPNGGRHGRSPIVGRSTEVSRRQVGQCPSWRIRRQRPDGCRRRGRPIIGALRAAH